MDILDKRYSKSPEIVSRKIADEYILVPIRKRLDSFESIYTLDEVSARIWELIDSQKTVKDIAQALAQEFEVDFSQAVSDTQELLSQLEEIQAVEL